MESHFQVVQEARLDKARHIKYWTRCLKTQLPYHYTSFDSNRMYLGYFILGALDLLDHLHETTSAEERSGYVEWIYSCQHPDGGFRMWKGTDFGHRATAENAVWDPANVAATYFALASLLMLGDDFKRVQRRKTLKWLTKLQRQDGSFGELLMHGDVEGGRDPRQGYCATAIRHILRGNRKPGSLKVEGQAVEDINVDQLVRCVRASESFEGGIADAPYSEPHAGYTFCSLGALMFVDRLNATTTDSDEWLGPSSPNQVLRWLVSRQTSWLDPDAPEGLSEEALEADPTVSSHAHQPLDQSTMWGANCHPAECAGMNGRVNKAADTCYAFWVAASLHIMGKPHLCDEDALKQYLLKMTQHPILGGFGKFPGDLPDLYHSYLGLVAYSLVGGQDVLKVNAGMCISQRTSQRLRDLWSAWDSEENGV